MPNRGIGASGRGGGGGQSPYGVLSDVYHERGYVGPCTSVLLSRISAGAAGAGVECGNGVWRVLHVVAHALGFIWTGMSARGV